VDGAVNMKRGEAQVAAKTKIPLPEKHSMRASRSIARKNFHGMKPIPDLPPKKMRYFSAPPYPRNHPTRRKKSGHKETPKDIPSDSDSIHNSDIPPLENQSINKEDFILEIVLPCASPSAEKAQQPGDIHDEAGSMDVLNTRSSAANMVDHRAGDIVLEPPSRQVMEASKIMSEKLAHQYTMLYTMLQHL
jgi:hypothetical protein